MWKRLLQMRIWLFVFISYYIGYKNPIKRYFSCGYLVSFPLHKLLPYLAKVRIGRELRIIVPN